MAPVAHDFGFILVLYSGFHEEKPGVSFGLSPVGNSFQLYYCLLETNTYC